STPAPTPFPYATLFRSKRHRTHARDWRAIGTRRDTRTHRGPRPLARDRPHARRHWHRSRRRVRGDAHGRHAAVRCVATHRTAARSEEHTSELQSPYELV